jgi:oxygen-independent coproporphyrinogen-3 oxidase
MPSLAVYVHIPFCRAKCAYCDFSSYAGHDLLFTPYLTALRREMAMVSGCIADDRARADRETRPASQTLYIGGGTPTVLPAQDLAGLVSDVRRALSLPEDAEITVEANPGTVDAADLQSLYQAGVNRLSVGVQSFDERLLRLLGRIHTAEQARAAVHDARVAGFQNLNLDLMFGLPHLTLQGWQEALCQAIELRPEHLSLYALTVEEGTPLAAQIEAGTLPPPDDDLAADMYDWAEDALHQAGYAHYEISNWALPGYACRHNLVYWRNEPYLGLGAGAHSWWGGMRWANLCDPAEYIRSVQRGKAPIAEEEPIGLDLEMGETMMMGLRLLEEGVTSRRFAQRFAVPLEQVYAAEIAELCAGGLLERVSRDGALERIRLTQRGHLLGNLVFARFLPDQQG